MKNSVTQLAITQLFRSLFLRSAAAPRARFGVFSPFSKSASLVIAATLRGARPIVAVHHAPYRPVPSARGYQA